MSHILDIISKKDYTVLKVKYTRHLTGDKKIERKGVMNRVKEFRKEKKMSQLELAKSIGVSRQTINMIENYKYNPTLELCINLAKTLDTDLNALFWDPQLTDEDSDD